MIGLIRLVETYLDAAQGSEYTGGMYYMPPLDDPDKSVLLAMQHAGVAPGWQLMSEASVDEAVLSKTAAKLMGLGLISAHGSIANPKDIGQVYFNIQPFGIQYADTVLNVR